MNWIARLSAGLLPLALLLALAVYLRTGSIEGEISRQVATALESQQLTSREIVVDGRDVRLGGVAATGEKKTGGMTAAANAPGVRRVDGTLSVVPVAKPFVFTAQRDGSRVTLSGAVPSVAAGERLAAAAKAAGFDAVDNNLSVAQGAPDKFEAAAVAGIAALKDLSAGNAVLSDQTLSVSGKPAPNATIEAALGTLRSALPPGIAANDGGLTYPRADPFTFEAVKTADGAVSVSGQAPSASLREAALRSAARAGAKVSGSLTLASGLPASVDYEAAVAFAADALAQMKDGLARLETDKLAVSGTPVGDGDALAAALAKAPTGVTVDAANITKAIADERKQRAAAAEAADAERQRLAAEAEKQRVAAAAAEEQRVAAAEAERQRVAAAEAERKRVAAAEAERQRVTAEAEAERQRAAEAERRRAAEPERQRAEAAAQAEKQRVAAAEAEAERQRPAEAAQTERAAADAAAQATRAAAVADEQRRADAERQRVEAAAAERQRADTERQRVEAAAAERQKSDTERERARESERAAADTVEATRRKLADDERAAVAKAAAEAAAQTRPRDIAAVIPPKDNAAPLQTATKSCDQVIDDVAREPVHFPTGSATLDGAGRTALASIAANLKECPSVVLSLGGHADTAGRHRPNLRLSLRRTKAVMRELVAAGVPRKRIAMESYGDWKPLDDNERAEGRQRNRRVEIAIDRKPAR